MKLLQTRLQKSKEYDIIQSDNGGIGFYAGSVLHILIRRY